MKSHRLLFAVLFAMFIFSSCQKEINDLPPTTPPVGNSARVKTYTEDYTTSAGHQAITFNLT
jgi:hypothetical protein